MRADEDMWRRAREALERVPLPEPQLERVMRRGRRLRARRRLIGGILLALAAAGVIIPLRLLSGLGNTRQEPASPPAEEDISPGHGGTQYSLRGGWRINMDHGDRVWIQSPDGWTFVDDPAIEHEPRILFGLGSWPVADYWEGEACGYDSVLRSLPPDGALLWMEEIRKSASLAKDLIPLKEPPRLRDLHLGPGHCVPEQPVYALGFRLEERNLIVSAAFGANAPESLRRTADEALGSLRLRLPDEPFPPEPSGPVTEVAKGTAFGDTWTLSAYRAEVGQWAGNICYRIVGRLVASGCADPKALAPKVGAYLGSVYTTGEGGYGLPDRAMVHGVVWKGVAGVTLTLDDGRVFSTQTLKSKALALAFYVIPFEGKVQIVSIEALDAEGNVLEETTLRP